MGYKDAEAFYEVDIPPAGGLTPLALRSVLTVVALATDDKTHETFISQARIAQRSGASKRTVIRVLDALEGMGFLTRAYQFRSNGGRSTDLITVHPRRRGDTSPGDTTSLGAGDRESLPHGHSDTGPVTGSQAPQRQGVTGNEITPKDHSSDQPLINPDRFDEFWNAWPRKAAKPKARESWLKAIRRAEPAVIIAAAIAYRDNPGRPEPTKIPHATTWLNQDRWDDPLEDFRPTSTRPTPTDRALGVRAAGMQVQERRMGLGTITTLNPKELVP